MATTTPAIELVGAILRQVLTDLQDHRTGHMRQEARAFTLGSGAEWWDETLGMSGRLVRQLRAVVRAQEPALPWLARQPALAAC